MVSLHRSYDTLCYPLCSGGTIPSLPVPTGHHGQCRSQRIDAAFTYIPKGRSLHCNCVAKFDNNFSVFSNNISAARASADQHPTLCPVGGEVQSLIYFSCLPDIPILSATNPWGDPWVDSVPRILFGKMDSGNITVSIEALHSFIDGIHLAEFYKLFSQILESPQEHFG